MPFASILGNDSVKRQLEHMLCKGTVGQSLLFSGPDGVGKGLFAEAVACELLCSGKEPAKHRTKLEAGTHPDLYVYRPEGKMGMHSIDALRRFSEEVYLYPYEAAKKVFIVHDAERMSPASANALLKTFEEPAKDAVIILLSSHPEALLPTILSRCRKVHFRPVEEAFIAAILKERGVDETQISLLARVAEGSIGRALQWAEEGFDPKRDRVLDLLAKGRVASYVDLVEAARSLNDLVEAEKKDVELILRKELLDAYPDPKSVTALQKQAIDKEVEGISALRVHEQVNTILGTVMSWYRDLHLLRCGGDSSLLFNADRVVALSERCGDVHIPSMDLVEKAVQETQLAVGRASPLAASLESLFLKLDLL